jgi:hypothetical protein
MEWMIMQASVPGSIDLVAGAAAAAGLVALLMGCVPVSLAVRQALCGTNRDHVASEPLVAEADDASTRRAA